MPTVIPDNNLIDLQNAKAKNENKIATIITSQNRQSGLFFKKKNIRRLPNFLHYNFSFKTLNLDNAYNIFYEYDKLFKKSYVR